MLSTPESIQIFLKSLSNAPGVYQMFNAKDVVIYVGKAKNLKKRVSQYFHSSEKDPKTTQLVKHIHRIETIVTRTESEAYLLENNLIKQFMPRYNILLRDDKSYPFITISTDQPFPRIDFFRGKPNDKGLFFGPYPSVGAVRETLNLLQKLFKIRQCRDSYFKSRSRPCLQYQIKRCTAPCVAYISEEEYQQSIKHAILFLKGKNQEILVDLTHRMDAASLALKYEEAARCRDLIQQIRSVQEQQYVTKTSGNIDVIVAVSASGGVCVHVLSIRSGRLIGSKPYFPKTPSNVNVLELLSAFLLQYYSNKVRQMDVPNQIILSDPITDKSIISNLLSELSEHKVTLHTKVRGERTIWLEMAKRNAENALNSHLALATNVYQRYEALQAALHLEALPNRIECFDISHSSGEATVGACVVFNSEGPVKSDYRRYNVKGITQGDDYAAMHQVLMRRYQRLKEGEAILPDILVVDGGRGQMRQVLTVLEDCQISGVVVLGIVKGEGRKAEFDHLLLAKNGDILEFTLSASALHLIQEIRDEAHRFAITGHRQRRDKRRRGSVLDDIEGIGLKRRQQLLKHFGGLQELERASIEAIALVPSISKALAKKIYDRFHG